MRTAIYPGSFDPITNGHLDVIIRTSKIFDTVYISVLQNSAKRALFTVDQRLELLRRTTADLPNVIVDTFDGLLVDYVRSKKAKVIVKGLRAISDFEYEFQMALANKQLADDIETMFIMTNCRYQYLSSSIVKEIALYGGELDELVPKEIIHEVYAKAKASKL